VKKTKTKAPTPAQPPIGPEWTPPEMTVEWQVISGDIGTVHVFTSRGAVFGYLAREWQRFVLSWLPDRTCRGQSAMDRAMWEAP
jgi:hypothetical protein